jgi:hypothetical protein
MTEYCLIDNANIKDFNKAVNNFLKDGWVFHGTTIIDFQSGKVIFYQAMVK